MIAMGACSYEEHVGLIQCGNRCVWKYEICGDDEN